MIDIVYGDCDASEGRCAPPLNIQIWPACERNLASYEFDGEPYPNEPLTVRDTRAAFFGSDGDARVEVYTGDVTVVVFGDEKEQLLRAAGTLRQANGAVRSTDVLPPPIPGALQGNLSCDKSVSGM
jgi:hypothetical protein